MVDAASLVASDLRLSVQRYTLLFEWLGIEECARTPGSFHPLIKLTFFSFCTCLDKQRTYGKTYADDVARSNFTPAGEAVYIDLDVDSVCVVLLFSGFSVLSIQTLVFPSLSSSSSSIPFLSPT